jgi:uncharacterized metal-binding protein
MSNEIDEDYQRMIKELEDKARREREQEDEDIAELFKKTDEKTIEELRRM